MIFNDEWTEGLSRKQQNLVIEYVLNEGKVEPPMAGYTTSASIRNFFESEKGRKALIKYIEFKCDIKRPIVKHNLLKLHLKRAFYNPADIVTPNGTFRKNKYGEEITDLRELGDDAYCIDGIKVTDKSLEIKLCDRNKSLEVVKQLFKIDQDEDDDLDEQSIFEMSNDEREQEIKRLIKKDQKLIEFKDSGKKDNKNKKI